MLSEQEQYDQWYREGLARCTHECSNTPGFIAQWNRLTGHQFTPASAPDSPEALAFLAFVDEHIWSHTVTQMWKALEAESN